MDSLTPMAVPLGGKAKNQPGYQCCTRCVTDTTDPDITFDEHGVCNHCLRYDRIVAERTFVNNAERDAALSHVVSQIKSSGVGRDYDCVIGVSGGVDSTYVAYLVKQLGLRPLAVHMDNGWNSELAVSNIQKTLDVLGIDLYTEVLDWDEFRDLQLAFLKASTPDGEVPTDHAIFALLLRVARENGIRYILSGNNFKTEGALVRRWAYGHTDWRYIRAVHRQFGSVDLESFPHISYPQIGWELLVRRVKMVSILNYVDYNKREALDSIVQNLDYRPYESKHYESIYTRFYQGHILVRKFGIDKRIIHYSDLIRAGEMSRDEALNALQKPALDEILEREDRQFVIKKLGISDSDFDAIMMSPQKTFEDYDSSYNAAKYMRKIFDSLRRFGLLPR